MMASLLLHWKSNNIVPFPKNYSSLIDYQYYLVVTLKWHMYPPREYRDPQPPRKKQQKEKTPPPQKKKKKKKKGQERKKKKKRGSYLCESSLGGLACWRAFIGKRLVRRGLQQQYLWSFRI